MDASKELPIIAMPGTVGNDPAQLDSLQLFVQRHIAGIETFWWCLWAATLAIVFVRLVIMPRLSGLSTGNAGVSTENHKAARI
ncbi:hypothetical protein G6L97_26535 (plasmid) [Agrobacterium tumefaciens]|uniref:hypothetical protein n=1 Tax=Agrobacterium tumefaciens TaxID=358 RepID=UPI0015722A60|nr:hypothetical protein [Agrobacterium tumefaciens]NSZ87680.1 hypothetical protein [Agrobacterium tumefaciens]WCA73004.1 hypothetical protein G6L97_26535 [Agrobacterium tumefaciens]